MRDGGGTRLVRTAASALGAVLGAILFGFVGSWSGRTWLGMAWGSVLGGLLARGTAVGTISPVTTSGVLFALLFCTLGPGLDDYGGHLALPGAAVGAFVGWLLRQRRRRS